MRLRVGCLMLVALFAVSCRATVELPETEVAEPIFLEPGRLPIDSGRVVLVESLCVAVQLLVVAEHEAFERGLGFFDYADTAATEWELRLYGLRYAAQFDPKVSSADYALIRDSTIALAMMDLRTAWGDYLPPTESLQAGAKDLREVMLRLCPTEWADEVATRVVAEWE